MKKIFVFRKRGSAPCKLAPAATRIITSRACHEHSSLCPPLFPRRFYRVAVDLAADRTPIEPHPSGHDPPLGKNHFIATLDLAEGFFARGDRGLPSSSHDDDDLTASRRVSRLSNFLLPSNLLTSLLRLFLIAKHG